MSIAAVCSFRYSRLVCSFHSRPLKLRVQSLTEALLLVIVFAVDGTLYKVHNNHGLRKRTYRGNGVCSVLKLPSPPYLPVFGQWLSRNLCSASTAADAVAKSRGLYKFKGQFTEGLLRIFASSSDIRTVDNSSKARARTYIEKVSGILKKNLSEQDLRSWLDRRAPLKPHQVISILHEQQNPSVAWKFFNCVRHHSHIRHHAGVHQAIARILGFNYRFDQVWVLLEYIRSSRCKFLSTIFNILINSYAKAGMPDHAISTTESMNFFGCFPDVHSYNPIFVCLYNLGDYDGIHSLFKEMQCMPNETTYNILLLSTSQLGDLEEVGKLVDRMMSAGLKVNALACISLFYILCSKGELTKAEKIWSQFAECGGLITDAVFWTAVISRLCKARRQVEAYNIFGHMVNHRLPLTISSCNALMDGFVKEGKVDEAYKLWITLRQTGIKGDAFSYSTLIHGFSSIGKFTEGNILLEKMEEDGCAPNLVIVNSLLQGLCSQGKAEDAFHLMEKMSNQHCLPDVISYSVLASGFCKIGKIDEALKVLNVMKARGCKPNAFTYNALIIFYIKVGNIKSARSILAQMLHEHCSPDEVTFNLLIGGYGKIMNLKKALHMFRRMKKLGVHPGAFTYRALVMTFCRVGSFQQSLGLFDVMLSLGLDIRLRDYNVLLSALCKAQSLTAAFCLMEFLKEEGFILDVITYSILIHGLCKCGRLDEALKLSQEMRLIGCAFNVFTYNALIMGFLQAGKYSDAAKIFELMIVQGCSPDICTYNMIIMYLLKSGRLWQACEVFLRCLEACCPPDRGFYRTFVSGLLDAGRKHSSKQDAISLEKRRSSVIHLMRSHLRDLCKMGRTDVALKLQRHLGLNRITEYNMQCP
ncbi:hypothetical protein KP509_19G060300 [Ceratopteris richardii]|uniref:Pentatricopeptide repeat-containing protein n=2 Tax=Ceratopteris richardii TaxID=49495 RepID=A0A8T2SMI1_CERRI|nr:hypothetical protein KP509_19G060300 [Ceratopteris richardii]KAH7352722.1 hypothetical protein KP509_19G060300 [Ceratopteris richardii]